MTKFREKLEYNMLGLKEAQKNLRVNETFQIIIDHAFQVRLWLVKLNEFQNYLTCENN